jgi:hypothetical protein
MMEAIPSMSKKGFPSKIHELVQHIDISVREISKKVPTDEKLEQSGCMVFSQLAMRNLFYHGLDRALLLAREAVSPYHRLVFLFADLAVWKIDRMPSPKLLEICNDATYDTFGSVLIPKPTTAIEEQLNRLYCCTAGQRLSQEKGADAYFTALAFCRVFGGDLSDRALLVMIRLMHTVRYYLNNSTEVVHLDEQALSGDIQKEVAALSPGLLNATYSFLFEDDPGFLVTFLWQKTPEVFTSLQRDGYSIRDYLTALMKNEEFVTSIDIDRLLHPFPEAGDTAMMKANLIRNLTVAKGYVEAKILAAAILDALASETGGDAPIMLFMGHFSEKVGIRFEELLTATLRDGGAIGEGKDATVMKLLEYGRKKEVFYDMKTSPFAAHLYYELSKEQLTDLSVLAHQIYERGGTSKRLLDALPIDLRNTIIDAAARMVPTRREKLIRLKTA